MAETIQLTEEEARALGGKPEHVRRVLVAFRQAMADHGVPPHLDGQCQSADCACDELTESIAQRAAELLGYT